MQSKLINIGRADIVEAEKKINEQIKDLEGFVSLKVMSNGQNDMAVVLYDGEDSEITKPTVKLVQFSITDAAEAKKTIDAALEDLDVISVESTCVVDVFRLIIVHQAKEDEEPTP